jgi:hypothetical protein
VKQEKTKDKAKGKVQKAKGKNIGALAVSD